MHAYMRFVAPSGNDLGIGGGLTSLLSTRRYLYNYSPELVNLELQKNALTADTYTFAGGQCVFGGVVFNGAGSDGIVDTPAFTPLMTNRLDTVQVEDLQGPAASGASTWSQWITGNEAPIEWDSSDNAYRRGSAGARVAGGGQVDIGNAASGRHGVWVRSAAFPTGRTRSAGTATRPPGARRRPARPSSSIAPTRRPRSSASRRQWMVRGGTPPSPWRRGRPSTAPAPAGDRNQFSTDGGPWTDSPPSFTLTADGDHTVRRPRGRQVRALERAVGATAIRIDATPPLISGAGVGAARGVLSWSMSDGVGFGACPTVVAVAGPGTGGALAKVFEQASGTLPAAAATVQLPLGAMPNGDYQANLRSATSRGTSPRSRCRSRGSAIRTAVLVARGGPVRGGRAPIAGFPPVAIALRRHGARDPSHVQHAIHAPRPPAAPRRVAALGAPLEMRDASGRYAAGARTDARGNFAITARATGRRCVDAQPRRFVGPPAVAWLEVRPILRVGVRMIEANRVLVAAGRFAPAVGAAGKAIQLQWFDLATRRWAPRWTGASGRPGRSGSSTHSDGPGATGFRCASPSGTDSGWPYLPRQLPTRHREGRIGGIAPCGPRHAGEARSGRLPPNGRRVAAQQPRQARGRRSATAEPIPPVVRRALAGERSVPAQFTLIVGHLRSELSRVACANRRRGGRGRRRPPR